MILASCRRDFDSNQFFGDLAFRRYPNLSDLGAFVPVSEREVDDEVADRHVLVLVHGYRNPLRNVAAAYRKLQIELAARGLLGTGKYDLVLGFLWPGFQLRIGFFAAVPWANRAASFFRTFLKRLNSSAHTVDVQTHSLGARVALQAMAFEREVWLDNLMLTAPAVDNECLEPAREFNSSLRSCRRCLVYHSAKDPVLKIAYRLGALDRALGFTGPENPAVVEADCPEVYVVNCTAIVNAHGAYRSAADVYAHWARVLDDSPLPRFETLAGRR